MQPVASDLLLGIKQVSRSCHGIVSNLSRACLSLVSAITAFRYRHKGLLSDIYPLLQKYIGRVRIRETRCSICKMDSNSIGF
jgi:hypothetical protein